MESGWDSELKTGYIKVNALHSITVTSPNGGESWKRGTTHTVTWDYTGSPGSNVKIMLYKAGTYVGTITDSAPTGSGGKGSYTWPISSTGSTGSDFKVGIQSITQPAIKDMSDNYFTVTSGATTPASITVTSPNGGEIWKRGNAYPINWSYTGSPGSSVSIVLFDGDTQVFTIASSTSTGSGGLGSYTWDIPSNKPLSNEYKVRVQSTSQSTVKDLSNNHFSIVAETTPTTSITVVSPNGGESWDRSISHSITWSYTGSPGSNVKIVLLKGGVEVGTIASSVPIGSGGKGSYSWGSYSGRVPGSDYKVSIQSISKPTIKDMSDNYFTVTSGTTTPASITVTSPNGGESWKRGTSHAITWSYMGSPGSTVKIVLLKGGVEVGTIASSVPIGSGGKGSYTWPISSSGYTGSDFKVSIQSISQTTIKDVSNNYFTISSGTTTKKPVASFNQDKYSGNVPLTVRFTDTSKNNPTSYLWSFGDGRTSTDKNPSHTYTKVGVYVIHLTATNSAGSDTSRSVVAVLPKWWHR